MLVTRAPERGENVGAERFGNDTDTSEEALGGGPIRVILVKGVAP